MMKGHTGLPANEPSSPYALIKNIPCTSAAFTELSAEVLGAGKHMHFQAHGVSMQPLIRYGDVLHVIPINAKQHIKMGLVVLCRKLPGQVVVQRVIRRSTDQGDLHYLVQGDQAAKSDRWIPAQDILGNFVAIESEGY